jgi:hypothetical protein
VSRRFFSAAEARDWFFANVEHKSERKPDKRMDLENKFTDLNSSMRPLLLAEHNINLQLPAHYFVNTEHDGT